MKTRIVSGIYFIVGLFIGLGALGHGFLGIKPMRAAVDASSLPADVQKVIWIVWYFVSGAMLVFGTLIIGAGIVARRGRPQVLAVPIVIAILYVVFGILAFAYQPRPFWLLFLVLGLLLFATSRGLRQAFLIATPD